MPYNTQYCTLRNVANTGVICVQAALRGIANVAVSVADDVCMLEEIRNTFEVLDEQGDGRVPYATFVEYLKSGGYELTETEQDVLVCQMDVEQAGCGAFCSCPVPRRYNPKQQQKHVQQIASVRV